MKYLITLFTLIISFCIVRAQTLPNGDFEDWSMVELFKEPTDYNTTNPNTLFFSQVITTTLVQGKNPGDSAIHLETIKAPNGRIEVGQMGNFNFLTGQRGTPFTGMPTTMNYRIRYNIQPGDSAYLALTFFSDGGIPVGGSELFITGNSNGWIDVLEPLQIPTFQQPSTYVLEMKSSYSEPNAKPGSYMDVDFIQLNGNQQIKNNEFEKWDIIKVEKPDYFSGFDILSKAFGGPYAITKSDDAISGDYSVRIETKFINLSPIKSFNIGVLHTGDIANWYLPIHKSPMALEGMYKYTPQVFTDFGVLGIAFVSKPAGGPVRRDTIIIPLKSTQDWTVFHLDFLPLNLPVPDSFSILIGSSNPKLPVVGSVLQVDQMQFVPITSVQSPEDKHFVRFRLSPNPVVDDFTIDWQGEKNENLQLEIYGQNGRLLRFIEDYKKNQSIRLDDFPTGYYSVRLQKEGFQKTFILYKS